MPYCQYCGKKLEEGEACACEMAQAAAKQPAQPEQVQQIPAAPRAEGKASTIFKKCKLYLSAYISNPEQAVRSVLEEEYDMTLPILLTVVRLLAMGLAIYGLLRRLCVEALSAITMALLRYGNSANLLTASLKASLPKSLIFGALIAALGMFLFIIVLFALAKIQHGDITISYVFKASAANGVYTSALLLLSCLLSFVSIRLCGLCMVLALLSWVICGVLTAQLVCPNNTSGAFWLLYFVGAVLIFVVGYYVFPPLFLRAAGGITASFMGEKVTLQTAFDEFKKDLDSVLGEENLQNMLKELVMGLWDTMY